MVSGNIPPAAGLSSSSALVSSSALATSLMNEVCHVNLLSILVAFKFKTLIDIHYQISEASVE